ncbi:MAG TPA: metal-dependent hydrolase [Azospirillum sp.]|nr:metal-dependent hydrolase [Azospirillum sp.]
MPNLTVRRPAIDMASLAMPDAWLGGDAFRTQVFNALSMMFPVGEQYFIDSVREGLPFVQDPELREDARRFIAQEATHSSLHRAFNDRLAQRGLRNRVEPIIRWRIRVTERMGVRHKLAVTMAYEHFTATFGDVVLRYPEWLAGASEPMRALWLWHAVEECEHRAIAFDVHRAAGGGYAGRIGWYLYVTLLFAIDTTIQTVSNLHRSGTLFRPATWGQGLRFLFGRGGLVHRTLPAWLAYFRPGFTPHDHGDPEAPRRWLEENAAWFARG